LIKPNASQGEIVAEAGRIKADALLKGITLSSEMALNLATKALNPGLISKYGNLALAGGALAAAGGAFTPPPQQDLTQLGFQPPTQEEIDANRCLQTVFLTPSSTCRLIFLLRRRYNICPKTFCSRPLLRLRRIILR
jgi:hypothetical protein